MSPYPAPSRVLGRDRLVISTVGAAGVGGGVALTAFAVLFAQRFGLVSAGVTLAVSNLARIAVLSLARRLDTFARDVHGAARLFRLVTLAATGLNAGLIAAAAWGPFWAAVALSTAVSVVSNLSTSVLHQQGREIIERISPATIVGVAIGAQVAATILALDVPTGLFLGVLAVLGAAQLVLMTRAGYLPAEPAAATSAPAPLAPALYGFWLALFAYGPLGLYAALVLEVSSPSWVGAAMISYAAGALLAPRVAKAFPHRDGFAVVYLLGAAGVATWAFAWSGPLVVLARFASGALLFGAQGRLLRILSHTHPGTSGVMATFTGLGVGAGVGGVLAGFTAAQLSVPGMGAVLALAALAVAASVPLWRTLPSPATAPASS